MQVGSLGGILFEVANNKIETVRGVKLSGGATIGTHSRHLNTSLAEFTGIEPETVSFNIRITQYLGADTTGDIEKIRSYTESGTPLKLVIGKKTYGRYRWLIKKYTITFEYYDRLGNLSGCDVNLSLTEYVK